MIADELMLFFRMEGIVLLPIHDSFIIRAGYELSLRSEMMIIFKRLMDSYILVKSTGSKPREYFNKSISSPHHTYQKVELYLRESFGV